MFCFLKVRKSTNFLPIPLPEVRGGLFVSPMPFGPYDTSNSLISAYRRHRIDIVVALVTDEEVARKAKRNLWMYYEKHGIETLRIPFKDLTCPVADQLTRHMPMILDFLQRRNVVVHCNAGVGRTGVVTCCIVRSLRGCSGEEAIAFMMGLMHTNMTDEQKRFVNNWSCPV